LMREQGTDAQTAGSASTVKGASYSADAVPVTSQTAALSVSAMYRAVELRANTMSQLVLEYQKKNNRAHGDNFVMDTYGAGSKLNYLLQVQPNPTMTWPQLMKQAEQQRVFQGNAVVWVERDSYDDVKALWLAVEASMDTLSHTYQLQIRMPGGDVLKSGVPASEVLHIRNTFSNDGGLTGVGTLRYMRQALSLAATNDKQALDISAKGGKMKLLVQENPQQSFGFGRASKKELEKATDELNRKMWAQDAVLLNNVMGATVIGQNAQQMELLESRKFDVPTIARYMGVPLVMLMHNQGVNYKSPEAATQEFLLRTIGPMANDWVMEMNAKLIGVTGYPKHRFAFGDDSLMRLDPVGRASISKTLLESGIKCVNELRQDYNLPAVAGGDEHLVSANLKSIGALLEEGQSEEGGAE